MPVLRVAAVSYFNARPLLGDLRDRSEVRVEEMPPAEVARALAEGRADVGLVPCAALLENERLTFLPGICIGARGEVDSVFLWLREGTLATERRREAAAGRPITIGLDPHSRSSRLLVRLWLEDQPGLDPRQVRLVEASPRRLLESEDERAGTDGFLVIGDLAMMREPGEGWTRIDLAEAWTRTTGLPFVFAVWGLDRDLLAKRPELTQIFRAALETGISRIDDYVAAEAAARGIDPVRAGRYLRERIVYRMDEDARRGLEAFLQRARGLDRTVDETSAGAADPAGDGTCST